jgi:hypothetical protein
MARKLSGEWEAKDARFQPFKSRKAMKEYITAGGVVNLQDLTFSGGHGWITSADLEPGEKVYTIYGPNPSRSVPNKWYASIENKGGKLVVA